MKKILIDQCLQCWHLDDDTYRCRETGERIINPYVIPADCPLDDEPEQKLLTGWVCPRCGKPLASFITECDCSPIYLIGISGGGTKERKEK